VPQGCTRPLCMRGQRNHEPSKLRSKTSDNRTVSYAIIWIVIITGSKTRGLYRTQKKSQKVTTIGRVVNVKQRRGGCVGCATRLYPRAVHAWFLSWSLVNGYPHRCTPFATRWRNGRCTTLKRSYYGSIVWTNNRPAAQGCTTRHLNGRCTTLHVDITPRFLECSIMFR
jgi:hypothetical protein